MPRRIAIPTPTPIITPVATPIVTATAQPTAADVAALAEISRLMGTLSSGGKAVARPMVATATKEAKAETRGHVEGIALADNDNRLLQVDIRLGTAFGTHDFQSGKGEAYLFQADAIAFMAFSKKWRLGGTYALEVK